MTADFLARGRESVFWVRHRPLLQAFVLARPGFAQAGQPRRLSPRELSPHVVVVLVGVVLLAKAAIPGRCWPSVTYSAWERVATFVASTG